MNEQALKLKVMKQVKLEFPGAMVWKLADQFASGRPDLLIIIPARYCQGRIDALHLFIELKRKGEKPRKLQKWVLDEINRVGGHAYSADTMEEVVGIINSFIERR